jgi:Fe-S-cluster containining protein
MTACASLLCNNCRLPGRCCVGFHLAGGSFGRGLTALELLVKLATVGHGFGRDGTPLDFGTGILDGEHATIGLPFLPFMQHANGAWLLWCPVLGRDGRCTDYENRPALCRDMQPGKGSLCAMHVPSGEGEPKHKTECQP